MEAPQIDIPAGRSGYKRSVSEEDVALVRRSLERFFPGRSRRWFKGQFFMSWPEAKEAARIE
jgi:hypothetical protein